MEKGVPDVVRHIPDASRTMEAALEWLRAERPALTFVHLDLVDHAGHEKGWLTPEYRRALEEADRLVGLLVDRLGELGLAEKTVLLVTSDHGGLGKKHGGLTLVELEIPWILVGPGVASGHKLLSPVNTFDTAATLAWVLGLTPPPCWIGRPVLEAFEQSASKD